MTMVSSFLRFGRRQLHTIVSREIIKPSSPTPSHLKTYNLSVIDQIAPDLYIPIVIFYPNSNVYSNPDVKMMNMKNSLSHTLTQYYPFAGRLPHTTPYFVDCNDEGVEFIEAHNDKPLSDFLNNMQHEDLDQLIPNGLLWNKTLRSYSSENDKVSPLAVQVNQFSCGGIGVAVSLSHKIVDGSSVCTFFNDWAIMTRSRSIEQNYVSLIDPYFLSNKKINLNYQGLLCGSKDNSSVTRSFMFHDSKLRELKHKVITMTAKSNHPIVNPTRLEVLNWLLYKCALKASAKNNFGSFKPTGFSMVTNIRDKMIEPLPKTTIGNFFHLMSFSTNHPKEITPSAFISQLKSLKTEIRGLQNIGKEFEKRCTHTSAYTEEENQGLTDGCYVSTGLCGFAVYGIDFRWGKPIKAAFAGTPKINTFLTVDEKNGDGIEVSVSLGKQDMEIFENDPELRVLLV